MFQDIVLRQMNEWWVPFGTNLNKVSDKTGQIKRVLAVYPYLIRTAEEYSAAKHSIDLAGLDPSVERCVLVAEASEEFIILSNAVLPDDIQDTSESHVIYGVARNNANMHGLSISQLTLPQDGRRSWVMNQLERVYATCGITCDDIEEFLSGALPVITVAVYDEKIIAAGMAKISRPNMTGAWKYMNVLGPTTLSQQNNALLYPAVWGEMVHDLVRTFFVS